MLQEWCVLVINKTSLRYSAALRGGKAKNQNRKSGGQLVAHPFADVRKLLPYDT